MRVIKRLALQLFWEKHPAAEQPLSDWYRITNSATWRNFPDVRRTFRATDVANVRSGNIVAIFDVGGNKFRLIAKVSYEKGKVYVLRVLTHKEYDTDKWKDEL